MSSGEANSNLPAQRKSEDRQSDEIIATTMTRALAMWWAPVVSGVACNLAEAEMVKQLFRNYLSRDADVNEQESIEWFFRKKYLIVNVATYAPWVGPAVQVLEVYALGRFVSTCLSNHNAGGLTTDWMERSWHSIESQIWAGEQVVLFYEQNSGSRFPENIRPEFIKAVEFIASAVTSINSVPGLSVAQELGADVVRDVTKGAKKVWKDLFG